MSTEKSMHRRTWAMLLMPPFVLLLVSTIFGLAFFMIASGDGSAIPGYFQFYMPLLLTVNHLILFFILRSFLSKDNLTFKSIGWFIDKKKWHIEVLVGLALAWVLYFFNALVVEPIQAIYQGNPADFSLEFSVREQIFWPFLAIAATLPIVEELIYRGYAYQGFKHKYSLGFTILSSSVLFGTLHWGLGILTAVLIIPFGILFFLVFLFRKRNLLAVTIGHCLYNSLVLVFV